MNNFLLPILERYLRREGLSYFLPDAKDKTVFSITLLLIICLSVAIIVKIFNKSFWLGFFIPIGLIIIYFALILLYYIFREAIRILRNKSKYDPNSIISQKDFHFLSISIILWLLLSPSIVLGWYIGSWIPALLLFGAVFIIIAFGGTYLINRDYWITTIIEIIVQILKGWTASWQAALSITPLLLVTILLSLFSSDMWFLLGKMSSGELVALIFFVFTPVFFAVLTRINLIDLISHPFLATGENIVDHVFSLNYFRKLEQENALSVEDRDDVIAILKWRNLNRTKELIAQKLETRIQFRYLLVIILTSWLLWLSFFTILYILFSYLTPSLSQMGWLTSTGNLPNIKTSIPQVASFLASVQTAAFAASLLDKPKDNILFKQVIEKAVDWMSGIIVFQAIYAPSLQMWESKEEAPWHKKFGVTALRGKVVANESATDEEVKKACEKLEEFYPRVQLIDFTIYRKSEKLKEKIRFGIEDFQWKYIHNRKMNIKQFNPIPFRLEIQEQHTLGREKLLANETIPSEWFGDNKKNSDTGKAIWESDINHEVIMHPCVYGDDEKNLHISICLFRRFQKSTQYSDLAHKVLATIQEKNPQAKTITIHFHFRSASNKIITNLMWIYPELITYKDEIKRKGNILTPVFSLFFKIKSWRKRKNK